VALAAIRRLVDRLKPNVLHGHGAKGGAYARLMPRRKDCIALYTPHGGSLHYKWTTPAGALYLGLEQMLRVRSDGLLFESRFGARAYAHKMGEPLCPTLIVHNGLSDGDFAALDTGQFVYDAVFVGELRRLKGVATLIAAVAILAAERPFKLAIAGAGPDEAEFRSKVKASGLDKHVDFLGYRPAREVFPLGRMVVVPSLAESFPYVVLEAMASGRPIVATKVGGIPEMFGQFSGSLVPPGDAGALADMMRRMMDSPAFARQRSAALQKRARALFAADQMAGDILRFYAELSGHPTRRTEPPVETAAPQEPTPV
jgi:glycosyltransferase involved in cell wall biosynthesis